MTLSLYKTLSSSCLSEILTTFQRTPNTTRHVQFAIFDHMYISETIQCRTYYYRQKRKKTHRKLPGFHRTTRKGL